MTLFVVAFLNRLLEFESRGCSVKFFRVPILEREAAWKFLFSLLTLLYVNSLQISPISESVKIWSSVGTSLNQGCLRIIFKWSLLFGSVFKIPLIKDLASVEISSFKVYFPQRIWS